MVSAESLNLEHMRTALAADNPAAFAATLEHFCFGMAHRNPRDEPTARVLLPVLCNLMTERSVAGKSNRGGDSDLEIELGGRGWVIEAKWNHPTAVARRQVEKRGYGRGGPPAPAGARPGPGLPENAGPNAIHRT